LHGLLSGKRGLVGFVPLILNFLELGNLGLSGNSSWTHAILSKSSLAVYR